MRNRFNVLLLTLFTLNVYSQSIEEYLFSDINNHRKISKLETFLMSNIFFDDFNYSYVDDYIDLVLTNTYSDIVDSVYLTKRHNNQCYLSFQIFKIVKQDVNVTLHKKSNGFFPCDSSDVYCVVYDIDEILNKKDTKDMLYNDNEFNRYLLNNDKGIHLSISKSYRINNMRVKKKNRRKIVYTLDYILILNFIYYK